MDLLLSLCNRTVQPLGVIAVLGATAIILLFPAEASACHRKFPILSWIIFVVALGQQGHFIAWLVASSATWTMATEVFVNCLPLLYVAFFAVLLSIQAMRVANHVSTSLVVVASVALTPWFASYSVNLLQQHFR